MKTKTKTGTPTLREFAESNAAFMKKLMAEKGEVMPMIVGYTANAQVYVVATRWSDNEEKIRILQLMRLAFVAWCVEMYAVMSEAWMATAAPGDHDLMSIPPSERSDRVEIIHAACVSRDASLAYMGTIKRRADGAFDSIVDDKWVDSMTGRMTDLLPPDDLPPIPPSVKDEIEQLLRGYIIRAEDWSQYKH